METFKQPSVPVYVLRYLCTTTLFSVLLYESSCIWQKNTVGILFLNSSGMFQQHSAWWADRSLSKCPSVGWLNFFPRRDFYISRFKLSIRPVACVNSGVRFVWRWRVRTQNPFCASCGPYKTNCSPFNDRKGLQCQPVNSGEEVYLEFSCRALYQSSSISMSSVKEHTCVQCWFPLGGLHDYWPWKRQRQAHVFSQISKILLGWPHSVDKLCPTQREDPTRF